MKLKTLKDIEEDWESHKIYNQESNDTGSHVEITPELIFHDLKQEVIKWITELKKPLIHYIENHPFYLFRHDTAPIIDFLIDRFNITKEELKPKRIDLMAGRQMGMTTPRTAEGKN